MNHLKTPFESNMFENYQIVKDVLLADYDYTLQENVHQYYNHGQTIKMPSESAIVSWFETMCGVFTPVQACNIVRKAFNFSRHTQFDFLVQKALLEVKQKRLNNDEVLEDWLPF